MIRYTAGDATDPEGDGPKVIVHVCNDLGAWGSGFVLAVSRRWPEPERAYRFAELALGAVQFVEVSCDAFVANMVAQHGFPSASRRQAVDYQALRTCLQKVADFCVGSGSVVHMPRIGCGIGGGNWCDVEVIIKDTLSAAGVRCVVYDLP